jgi:hypothetical protein
MTVCGAARAEDISKFGAMVWAVSNIIEGSGVQTEIELHFNSRGIDTKRSRDFNAIVEIKKPGEYIAPNLLAAVVTGLFFRRAIFRAFVIGCDVAEVTACEGLGRGNQEEKLPEFSDGKLLLKANYIVGYSEDIEKGILKAFDARGAA